MNVTHTVPAPRLTLACVTSALVVLLAAAAAGAEPADNPHCGQLGGTLFTNFISDTTTLGVATGDLRGAVSATLLGQASQGDSIVFTVQHHWVTEAGDTIFMDPAQATVKAVPPALFAIQSYPVTITGGTGRFAGAAGHMDVIGEFDAATGRTVFRYHGNVCLAASSN